MSTPEKKETQERREIGDWYQLILYTTIVLTVGFLAGHLVTLCPTTGLRAANYSWTMYVLYGLMIVFALAMFVSTGYRLKGAAPSGKDVN